MLRVFWMQLKKMQEERRKKEMEEIEENISWCKKNIEELEEEVSGIQCSEARREEILVKIGDYQRQIEWQEKKKKSLTTI